MFQKFINIDLFGFLFFKKVPLSGICVLILAYGVRQAHKYAGLFSL